MMLASKYTLSLVAAAMLAIPSASAASVQDRNYAQAGMIQLERRAFNASKYPPGFQSPPQSSLPQDWVDALNTLQQQGKIPNIAVSTATDQGVTYPSGTNGNSKEVCSWTISKCYGPNDIKEMPNNNWLIAFDDGPTQVSNGLYDFLHSHNQPGTHFMIGSQILSYPDQVKHAMQTQQQPAVHTWSHTEQTSRTNMEVLGELGWTMQIIYDLAGVVPRYWRPPQGDVDARVRAIAEGVFNLTTVMWNYDSNDWCMSESGKSECPGENPGESYESIEAYVQKTLKMPQTPGIIMLEHELTNDSVGLFENYYPQLAGLGWKPTSVPESQGVDWYHNAVNNNDTPIAVTSMLYSTVVSETKSLHGTSSSAKTGNSTSSPSTSSKTSFTSSTAPPSSKTKTSGALPSSVVPLSLMALAASTLSLVVFL